MKATKTLVIITATIIAIAAMHATQAAVVTWSGGSGNWNDDASWGGAQPTTGDAATINSGGTVAVTVTGETAGSLVVNGGGTVNVLNGGNLALPTLNGGTTINISGTLNVAGGTVTTGGGIRFDYIAGGGQISVSSGTLNNDGWVRIGNSGIGTLSVSGSGTYSGVSAGRLYMAPGGLGTTGIISLSGSSASINNVTHLYANSAGNTTFTLAPGSGGIDVIDVSSTLDFSGSGTETLNFNADGYRGAKAVTLFSYGSLNGTFDTANITATGYGNLSLGSDPGGDPSNLGQGEYFLDYTSGNEITLYYNAPIPEPSTLALLGSALGVLYFSRRRNRG